MMTVDHNAVAQSIVTKIKRDLTGRGGLDGAWDSIDGDIQQEIVNTWKDIVLETLDTFYNNNY